MNDWRKPCEHGVYVGEHSTSHWDQNKLDYVLDESSVCPGGSPVTVADLEGLGHRWWVCGDDFSLIEEKNDTCAVHLPTDFPIACGWRLLIPIPDPQPATEWGPDHPSYDEMGQ